MKGKKQKGGDWSGYITYSDFDDNMSEEQYQQWKNKLGEQFKSFNQRQLDQKTVHDEAEIRRKETKDRLDRIADEYRLDRREAAARDRTNIREDQLDARERERTDREEQKLKFKEYNETRTRIIPSLNRAINAAEISLTNAPKDQKPAIEAEIKELKGQRTDAFEVINSLRKELKLPPIPEPKEKPDSDKPEIKPIRVGGFEIAPAEPAKRVKGKTYKLPNGLYDWTGTGWVPSKEKEK
jgi:chromosome segregation ATPase